MLEALSCTDCLGEETSCQSLKERQDCSALGLRKEAENSAARTLVGSVNSLAPSAPSVQSAWVRRPQALLSSRSHFGSAGRFRTTSAARASVGCASGLRFEDLLHNLHGYLRPCAAVTFTSAQLDRTK